MRRALIILILLTASIVGGAHLAHAADAPGQFQFQPIVSIPLPTGSAVNASTSLTDYLNAVFTLSIGIAAILGVVMITFEGLKYMTSDVIGKKQSAVEGIQGAAFGLILLLLSYIILNVINPNILNLKALTDDLSALGGSGSNVTVPLGSSIATGGLGAAGANTLPSGTDLLPYTGTLKAGCTLTCRIDNKFLAPGTNGCAGIGEAVQSCPASTASH